MLKHISYSSCSKAMTLCDKMQYLCALTILTAYCNTGYMKYLRSFNQWSCKRKKKGGGGESTPDVLPERYVSFLQRAYLLCKYMQSVPNWVDRACRQFTRVCASVVFHKSVSSMQVSCMHACTRLCVCVFFRVYKNFNSRHFHLMNNWWNNINFVYEMWMLKGIKIKLTG